MRRLHALLHVLLLAAFCDCVLMARTEKPGISLTYQGRATFNSKEFGNDGHCSLGLTKSLKLPWKRKVRSVAINSIQYNTSAICGMCVAIKGVTKNGRVKSKSWTYGMVVDECPKCKFGDIVIYGKGGGYHNVEWKAVQCNVAKGKFQYAFQGSNEYYLKLAITNTRVPVNSVALVKDKKLYKFRRTVDNFWEFNPLGKVITFPIQLAITSLTGRTVVEKLAIKKPVGIYKGKGQFPYLPAYAVVQLRR